MIHPRQLLAALPVATLAVALAACTPPEESPPMDPPANVETAPANVETAPANDPWTQPETGDPAAVDPMDDPWTDPMPPEDQPPTPIDPTLEPVDEQVPEPEEVIDPVDP